MVATAAAEGVPESGAGVARVARAGEVASAVAAGRTVGEEGAARDGGAPSAGGRRSTCPSAIWSGLARSL
jgi:hypothetical protein